MVIIELSDSGMEKAITDAAGILGRGGIVAFPTESFYGLGVRYDNLPALERLYTIKQRPKEKSMPLIIGNRELLDGIAASINRVSEELMEKFWPGPLTVLLPARSGLPEFVTAGTGKIAVRMPGQSIALHLARALDFPVTATSANISGMPPADDPDDVIQYFGDSLDLLIDGGTTPGGEPSTIVDATGDGIRIVRQGAISSEELMNA
jgi:L-threonylcarbamoyladenylate synthase